MNSEDLGTKRGGNIPTLPGINCKCQGLPSNMKEVVVLQHVQQKKPEKKGAPAIPKETCHEEENKITKTRSSRCKNLNSSCFGLKTPKFLGCKMAKLHLAIGKGCGLWVLGLFRPARWSARPGKPQGLFHTLYTPECPQPHKHHDGMGACWPCPNAFHKRRACGPALWLILLMFGPLWHIWCMSLRAEKSLQQVR